MHRHGLEQPGCRLERERSDAKDLRFCGMLEEANANGRYLAECFSKILMDQAGAGMFGNLSACLCRGQNNECGRHPDR